MDLSYVCRGKQGHKVPSFMKVGAGLLTLPGTEVALCVTVRSRQRPRKPGQLHFHVLTALVDGGVSEWHFSYKNFSISSPNF